MDFQSHQAEARQNTTKLIALFVAALLSIAALVSIVTAFALNYFTQEFSPILVIAAGAASLLVVGAVSLGKSTLIKGGGGSYVATSMGGRPIDFNTLDPAEKQLSNVVEEIAIASGLPVPAVFILDDEPGINAFAVGWTADNAAIGVTRGALQHLSRSELQGVIAHEFAHIRNGDTKIKTRIIGWVFGIAVLSVLGRLLLEAMFYAPRRRSSSNNKNVGGLLLAMTMVGVGLLIIGSVGTFFARMIQAAVSRQREHLADASAVQFTRDPDGLGQALSKIGGMSGDNRIRSPHAVEAGHLFFASAMNSRFATHPPLKSRISRLVPSWDGSFRQPDPQVAGPAQAPNSANTAGWGTNSGQQMLPGQAGIPGMSQNKALPVDPAILMGAVLATQSEPGQPAVDQGRTASPGSGGPAGPTTGRFQTPTFDGPTEAHIGYARYLLGQIPEETQNYLHTRAGAVAAVVGLLVSNEPGHRESDLERLAQATALDASYIDQASTVITSLGRPSQLPAIDIALHSIREIPWEYQEQLRQAVLDIESSRPDQDLFRWMLRRVVIRHLEDQHDTGTTKHDTSFDDVHADVKTVLTAVAWFNSLGKEWAPISYAAGLQAADLTAEALAPEESLSVPRVDEALERLSHLDMAGRHRFVKAALAIVDHDQKTTAEEAELIRVVADAVRLPMPPLLPV